MKTIQIKFKTLFILLILSCAFSSCTKEDEPDPQGNDLPIALDCNSFQSNNSNAISVLENRSDGVDYIINCVIPVEVDLKIQPGVVIEFTDAAGMEIKESGSINAVGSQSEPILFTASTKTKGAWKGIISRSQSVKNRFDYVTIEYAGDGGLSGNGEEGSLIFRAETYFRLNNVTIKNGLNYGINSIWYNYDVEINNCTITGCEMPIFADTNIVKNISGGDFTGNTTDVIRLFAGDQGAIGNSQTWKKLSVPYRTSGDIVIVDGAKLTLEPGLVLEFEETRGLVLDKLFDEGSALIAVGTPSNPIIFTGVTKVPGSWGTLSIRRSTSVQNKIDNVLIEYAGGSGAGGAIEMWVDPYLTVTNTTFKDIDACALYSKYTPTNPNLTEGNNTLINVNGDYMCSQ
ncbi:hypothetical protein [Aequorivita sp. CIP111184]|uniref:hypothetical protein n=1 Tax=Aequorivita sp. CIP111184 TaxID=2211356 RepID=UPI000DBBF3BB|nr:hypothetical protein [Aequorivita sp. CIP111184]SRX55406.1 hypothetical protein AEQU1_02428 [Aequorivita sp. CIP111184]